MVLAHSGTEHFDPGIQPEALAEGTIPSRQTFSGWCARIGLPQDMTEALCSYLDDLGSSPDKTALFHSFRSRLELQADWPDPAAEVDVASVAADDADVASVSGGDADLASVSNGATDVASFCGDDAWRFGLVAYLSMLPRAEAWYKTHGIGMDIFDATMADIGLWGANNTARHGAVRFSEFSWIHLHLSCRLFRLGRLQFVLLPYHGDALFLRHRQEKRIVALAMPGIRIRSDGYLDGTDGWTDEDAWTTELMEPEQPVLMEPQQPVLMKPEQPLLRGPGIADTVCSGSWRGHRIDPDGRTHREPAGYPCADWEVLLQPGDDTLDVHIPQGSPLDIEASLASFEQALPFFRQVFPQRTPQAFHCHSWLLAPQFGHMLPESSNIVRFGNLFYRYPSEGDRKEAWERVFGHHAPTLAEAPRGSSLQRALHDWLSEGRLVCSMAGMHFHDGMKNK